MRRKGKRTRNILLSLMFVALLAVVAIMVCDMAVYYDAKGKLETAAKAADSILRLGK